MSIEAVSGAIWPVMTRTSVVLPAPWRPISPIRPRGGSLAVAPSMIVRPPSRTVMSVRLSMAAPVAEAVARPKPLHGNRARRSAWQAAVARRNDVRLDRVIARLGGDAGGHQAFEEQPGRPVAVVATGAEHDRALLVHRHIAGLRGRLGAAIDL